MPRKKIVFVIVEGPSDDQAIGVLINRIFNSDYVYVHVMHCDITTERNVNPGNIIAKIGNLVKGYAGRNFKPQDFSRVIHIVDTDGAFIPDNHVTEDAAKRKPYYSATEICTCNKAGIEERNRQKRANLERLAVTSKVWKTIPYQVYYMSCNLDHALYGKLNSADDEKEKDALEFAERYMNDIPAFMAFISNSDFSVMDGYQQSWQYIREGLHSLERHTNFGLCFKAEEVTPKDTAGYGKICGDMF